jgi:hypothetical protein
MKDLVAISLLLNLLRNTWVYLVLIYDYVTSDITDVLFARGFLLGMWNSLELFFLPTLGLLVAFSLMYMFDLLINSKETLEYLYIKNDQKNK